MVLAHLVSRCGDKTSLDRRLLASNPVLEAFGNATTQFNPNSSRFGKLLRLEMMLPKEHKVSPKVSPRSRSKNSSSQDAPGEGVQDDTNTPLIIGASIETYLLERSRITSHHTNEHAYHVYYLLLHGLTKSKRKAMGLNGGPSAFIYATPSLSTSESTLSRRSASAPITTGRLTKRLSLRNVVANAADSARGGGGIGGGATGSTEESSVVTVEAETQLAQLRESLEQFGIHEKEQDRLFSVVAAVLQLGNIVVNETDRSEGRVASVSVKDKSLGMAADQLGLAKEALVKLLCERKVKVGLDVTVTFKTPEAARFERDALARAIYSRTFDWLVASINSNLSSHAKAKNAHGGGKGSRGTLHHGLESNTGWGQIDSQKDK
jgi:myosin heavy subunit